MSAGEFRFSTESNSPRPRSARAFARPGWRLVVFGWLLPLYLFGWLAEASLNRGGLDWDMLGACALAVACVSGLSLVRSIPTGQPMRAKNRAGVLSTGMAGLVVVFAGYVSSDLWHDNLRVIVAGQAYRSGQMDKYELARCIGQFGIKSIVNLRGKNSMEKWYQDEIQTSAHFDVAHYDFSLSSGQELEAAEMGKLVRLLRNAAKPVLIHCQGGADRSGLASALYRFKIEGCSPAEASRELSLWNGHVPWLRPWVSAMDHSFWRYVSNHPFQAQRPMSPTN